MKKISRRRLRLGAIGLATTVAIGALTAGIAMADPLASQVRVSVQGPGNGTGNAAYDAVDPAVAYSEQRNQYLMVWEGDTSTAGEEEIWARIIGADGTPTGGVVRVSNMGTSGNGAQDAFDPKVAYNPNADEYLVVWHGDHELDGLAANEDEVWGRRIKGDGTFASDQFRISEMGTDGSALYEGFQADVVYNADLDQYVVVWRGDQPTPGDGQEEIWAKRLNPDGTAVDADEVRVSDIGPEGNTANDAFQPEVAYDPDAKQYLVVFYGDDVVNQDFVIYGQRLGQGLGQVGANDFPISTTAAGRDALSPEVAYNAIAKRFMVAWHESKPAAGEFEIYGQLIDGSGTQTGTDDFRVSTSGPDGNAAYDAFQPMVVSNGRANEFLVAWYADDDQPGLALNENEIFAQRFTGAGVPVGTPEARVSMMGPDGDPLYAAAGYIGGAYNSIAGEYLIGWEGDDNTGGLLDGELEVYARRHGAGTATEPFPPNCKPVPPRGTPNEVQVPSEITTGYLKTNQRTGSATVRRANALDSWMNAGIVDKDLCGGAIAPEDLDSNLTSTSGPLGPSPSEAAPRTVDIAPASSTNATFTANAIQMCINQRIYQAAIARANALKERLDGKLTGGDLVDGTLTQSRLRQDLTITAATNNPSPPAASKTDVKQPQRQGCDAVKFTTQQAAINRRIAIQSVVRINEVLDEVNGGLDSANFMDGAITRVDFAPGVTP